MNRYFLLGKLLIVALSAMLAPARRAAGVFVAESRPNIVVILCDNLGNGDIGCFNPAPSTARRTSTAWRRRGGGSRASTPPAASARPAAPR